MSRERDGGATAKKPEPEPSGRTVGQQPGEYNVPLVILSTTPPPGSLGEIDRQGFGH
jgi:hypothetical protein